MVIRTGVWSQVTRLLVAGVAVALMIVSLSSSAQAADPTTTSTVPLTCGVQAGSGVTVTGGSPCVVVAPVGSTFELTLRSGLRWRDPHSSSTDVAVANVQAGSNGGLSASVTALVPGTATLSASASPICAPGQACPQFILLWTLSVVVTGTVPPPAVVVTTHDMGRHYTIRLGQRTTVRLSDTVSEPWSEPTAKSSSSLRRIKGASGNPAYATFIGVKRGQTIVTSSESSQCAFGCTRPSYLFRVTIRVE